MDNDRVDGRTARRDRNREAVLDAVLDLFSEANLSPGVDEVAERSGVSLRSVYRYYDDMGALIGAAIERQIERARPLFRFDDVGEGPLEKRIERFSAGRVRLFEEVRLVYRAAGVRGADQPQIAEGVIAVRGWLTAQTENMFAPELSALPAEEAASVALQADVVGQFDTLEHVRGHRGLSVDETVAFVASALRRTLG